MAGSVRDGGALPRDVAAHAKGWGVYDTRSLSVKEAFPVVRAELF